MMPRVRVGIIVERPKAAARQHDRTTAAARIRPPARANPSTVERTQPAASTGQERERSQTPATRAPVGTRAEATGLIAGATAVARQPMGQERERSHTPATRAPVGTGAEATGLMTGATAVARQPMGQERERSQTPATRAPVGTGAEATGLIAGGTAVARHLIIVLACMGNMDEAAGIGETTPGQATAGAHISRAGDITARVDTTQGATGEASIIDTRTMGRAHIVIPEQPPSRTPSALEAFHWDQPVGFGPSGAPSVAPAGLRRAIVR